MKSFLATLALIVASSIVSITAFAADPAPAATSAEELLKKYACIACHSPTTKLVGPAYKDIAAKYRDVKDADKALAGKVKGGSTGTWGAVPMPPNHTVPDADLQTIIKWILAMK